MNGYCHVYNSHYSSQITPIHIPLRSILILSSHLLLRFTSSLLSSGLPMNILLIIWKRIILYVACARWTALKKTNSFKQAGNLVINEWEVKSYTILSEEPPANDVNAFYCVLSIIILNAMFRPRTDKNILKMSYCQQQQGYIDNLAANIMRVVKVN
jgi:hypothetical protein